MPTREQDPSTDAGNPPLAAGADSSPVDTRGAVGEPTADSLPGVAPKKMAGFRECLALIERVRQQVQDDGEKSNSAADVELPAGKSVRPPSLIGRFEIVRELGRGGSGVVLLARDPELNRCVALKIPRPEALLTDELQKRFLHEAKAAAALSHPAIVSVYEAGSAGSIYYIAAEYCAGVSLAEWMAAQSRPVSERTAAAWTAQLADAVQHAHEAGVLHRDLKPGNVLLVAADASRSDRGDVAPPASLDVDSLQPKLMDFGLAKLSGGQASATRTGAVLGTPAYMAPEQAEGRLLDVDGRSDVYGLGAILYEMLTGGPPFRADSEIATLLAVRETEPPSPSRMRPGMSRDLEAICLKCLEKNPTRRYRTAAVLGDDLRRYLSHQQVIARRPTPVDRLRKWSLRHQAAVWAMMITLLGISTVLSISQWFVSRANREMAAALGREELAAETARAATTRSTDLLFAADVRLAGAALANNNFTEARERLARHIPRDGTPDRRGFAWYYSWTQLQQEEFTLTGQGATFDVEYSPDGSLLAISCESGKVALHQADSGARLAEFADLTTVVRKIEFSPDGKLLAALADDGAICLWNVEHQSRLAHFVAHPAALGDLAFHPDGQRLAIAGQHSVKLYRLPTASGAQPTVASPDSWALEQVGSFDTPSGAADAIDISADGQWLAVGGEYDPHGASGYVTVWNLTTEVAERERLRPYKVTALRFARTQPMLAVGTQAGHVLIWDVEQDEELAGGPLHNSNVYDFAFSHDDALLVSASKDSTTRIWDLQQQMPLRVIQGHDKRVYGTAVCPKTANIATASKDGTVKVWHLIGSSFSRRLLTAGEHPVARFAPDGESLVEELDYGSAHWHDLRRDNRKHWQAFARSHVKISWQSNGQRFVMSGKQEFVVYNADNLQIEHELQAVSADAVMATLSPNGSQLATLESDDVIRVWNLPSEELAHTISDSDVEVVDIVYSRDGRYFLSTCGDNLRIRDARNYQLLDEWQQHDNTIIRVVVSADSQQVATVSNDFSVRLWSLAKGRQEQVLLGHKSRPRVAVFSDDGRRLATAAKDGTVRIWDVVTGQELLVLRDTAGIDNFRMDAIQDLVFRDGRTLVAAVRDDEEGGLFLAEWQAE